MYEHEESEDIHNDYCLTRFSRSGSENTSCLILQLSGIPDYIDQCIAVPECPAAARLLFSTGLPGAGSMTSVLSTSVIGVVGSAHSRKVWKGR